MLSQVEAWSTTDTPISNAINEMKTTPSIPENKTCRAKTLRAGALQVEGLVECTITAHVTEKM